MKNDIYNRLFINSKNALNVYFYIFNTFFIYFIVLTSKHFEHLLSDFFQSIKQKTNTVNVLVVALEHYKIV